MIWTLSHRAESRALAIADRHYNRQTIGAVRTLKDGIGNYLWMPGLQNGLPNSINGMPYYEFPDMPAVGASTSTATPTCWRSGRTDSP